MNALLTDLYQLTMWQAYLSEGMVDDLKDMYAEAPNHRSAEQGGLMYGFYISNNVGITLARVSDDLPVRVLRVIVKGAQ